MCASRCGWKSLKSPVSCKVDKRMKLSMGALVHLPRCRQVRRTLWIAARYRNSPIQLLCEGRHSKKWSGRNPRSEKRLTLAFGADEPVEPSHASTQHPSESLVFALAAEAAGDGSASVETRCAYQRRSRRGAGSLTWSCSDLLTATTALANMHWAMCVILRGTRRSMEEKEKMDELLDLFSLLRWQQVEHKPRRDQGRRPKRHCCAAPTPWSASRLG